MPFENPILAGEELIRPGIKSEDYIEGKRGWRIARDGTVEFQNIVNRGNASFEYLDASYFEVGGMSIPEMLNEYSRGMIGRFAWGYNGRFDAGAGERGIFEFSVKLYAGRMYVFRPEASVSYLTDNAEARIILKGTAAPGDQSPVAPTINSDVWYARQYSDNRPIGYGKTINGEGWFVPGYTGIHRILFVMGCYGGGSFDVVFGGSLPDANISIYDAGLENKSITYGGLSTGGGSTTPPPAPRVRYDNTWWNTDVQSYSSDGNFTVATNGGNVAYQGDGGAVGNPGGNHCGFFTFDAANIRAALAGATILESYIFLDNEHSYLSSGVEAVIGTHNNEGIPGTAVNRFENRWRQSIGKGGEFWTGNLGGGLGNEFRDGGTRGVMVGYGFNGINHYSRWSRAAVRFIYEK